MLYTHAPLLNKLSLSVLIYTLFMTAIAFAEQENKLLVVRVDQNYPPYEMISKQGDLTGLHIDLISATAKQLGIAIEFKSVPWKRALYMVKHGKADAVSYIGKTPKREAFAIFHDENILSYGSYVFFTLNEYKSKIHFEGQLKQLQPYRIGTVMGYDYSPKLNNADYLTIDNQSKSENALFKRLLNKHFHIGLGDKAHIALLARQNGASKNIHYLSPALSYIPHYIAFSRAKNHDILAKKFGQTMHEFKATPEYQDLLSKYLISN